MVRLAFIGCLLAIPFAAPAQEIRAFWADGFADGFKSPEQVDLLLKRLRTANCNAIFAQMRKSGDAYYLSRYEPWASDDQQRFDALAYLIKQAHEGTPRIQVHAWLNTCATGKSRGNPFHITELHPDWLSISDTGEKHDGEASKIDPGNPDAADWTFRVYLDVVRHYDVDGIHFDFVRYGSTDGKGRWGYNPVSVGRFMQRYGRTSPPKWDDPLWKQWRRDQVTALVRKVYAMTAAVNPKVAVSAATITWGEGPQDLHFWNEKSAPMNRVFQDWRSWMREGILDLNCQMSYYSEAKHPDWFRHWIDWGKDNQYGRWAVPGSGIWLNPIPDSMKQISAVRAPSKRGHRAHGVMLYSYNGTDSGPDGKGEQNEEFFSALGGTGKAERDGGPRAERDGARSLRERAPFAAPSSFPAIPWKEHPKRGHVMGFVLESDGLRAVDGAAVTVSHGTFKRQLTADGTGFFAAIDLPPGEYRVSAKDKGFGLAERRVTVTRGRSVNATLFLSPAFKGSATFTRALAVMPDGSEVRLKSMLVVGGTDTFIGNLYAVDSSGGGPIRIVPAGPTVLHSPPPIAFQPGDEIAVQGTLVASEGERLINQATVRLVGMRLYRNSAPAVDGKSLIVSGGSSLATVHGRVVEARTDRFTLDDGVKIQVMLDGVKEPGVESIAPLNLHALEEGAIVQVTGIATVTERNEGGVIIRIRPRSESDIVVQSTPTTGRLRLMVIGGLCVIFGGLILLRLSRQPRVQA